VSDLRTRLDAALGTSYLIDRELGGGGMSRVFLATDRALTRRVVIKVLSPELSAEVSARRFAREIRLAASLQQANIVPVLSAGEIDGVPHYIMPFVEGLSLRAKLERDPPLSLRETIGILRDVARALAYAHERGVVHRDIKPENILLSGDAAVVTDFGVAKALAVAKRATSDGAERESTVTHVGMAVGTPAYMSPEQVSADPSVDHRADIYSLGCVGYELLTGSPPFRADTLHALFAAHLSHKPEPIAARRPDAPELLASLVMRCLEKDAAHRPQSAREILAALADVPTAESSFARFSRRLPPRQRRALAVAATALTAVAAAALLVRGTAYGPAVNTLAVVPFLNVGGDSAQEYLADGMADELATALGKVRGVRVASRSLGYRYKGRRDLDASTIGRELSVNHVVQGSVRRVGNRLRVSAQLTSARDNSEIWSETFDRSAADAYALRAEIARGIAGALGGDVPASPSERGTTDGDAYDLYLRGRFLLQRRGTGVRRAIDNLERSIARDSAFAQAHASLALALELLPYFEPVNARALGTRAIAAARRALAIDSTIAEAHTALAMAHQHLYQWDEAERSYRRALELTTQDAEAHMQYARFLWYMGRVAEAVPLFSRARELDPFSAQASGWHGYMLFLRGREQQGFAEMRRAVEIDSTNAPAVLFLATALRAIGESAESRLQIERIWRHVPAWRVFAVSIADSVWMAEVLRELEPQTERDSHANTSRALIRVQLGDSSGYFDAIERATAAGEIWPTYYSLSEPRFDYLRRSARFADIVRRVGLDVATFTSPTGGRIR
jgi:serine/threonine-protein kinase